MRKTVSVVIPVYNEGAGICRFLDRDLLPVLKKLSQKIEVIIVDDGSSDNSIAEIKKSKLYQSFTTNVICLARNFGKEVALSAGINAATGHAIILIDADGQHPASAIPKMLKKWTKGAHIVTAVRGANTTKHRLGSRFYYWLMEKMGSPVKVGAMDFRLIDREVAGEFKNFTEKNRLTRGLIDWLGYPQEYLEVNTGDRIDGQPTYSIHRLASLTIDTLISTSRMPLIIFGFIGIFITIFSLLLGIFILIQQYILHDPLNLDWSGAVAMCVFIAFLVGIVLISQTLIALYISQIHAESKNRPLYVIDRKKSFKKVKK